MKKIIISLIVLLGFTSVYATGSSGSSGYANPILDNSLNFSATLDGSKVYTSWAAYDRDEGFVYYKVVRSQTKENPVYPDDGYIKYTTDVNETSYTDASPLNGTSYYRVCAITSEKNRYCSNVVKIYKEKIEEVKIGGDKDAYGCYISAGYSWCEAKSKCIRSWEEKCEKIKGCTEEAKICPDGTSVGRSGPNCEFTSCPKPIQVKDNSTLSYTIKQKAEKLVNTFITKVEKAYSSTDKRIEIINKVIDKLNVLAVSKPSQKQIIDFIVTKLKAKVDSYKGSDLGDIESIFGDIE